MDNARIILQTKKWINEVVIGCNFCPFAAKEVNKDTIHYCVEYATSIENCLQTFMQECHRLDNDPGIETTLLIFPNAVPGFEDYLELLDLAEQLLEEQEYEGVYQVASFHPHYRFAGSTVDDAANYTNRSIYPMLHLLREESIEKALEKYSDSSQIPDRNIKFAREKGVTYFKMLRDLCTE